MNWKKVLRYVGVGLLVAVAALTAAKYVWDARCFAGYDRLVDLKPTESRIRSTPLWNEYRVTFQSTETQTVPGLLAVPRRGTSPYPCLVFLYGIGQEKEFLHDIAAPFVASGFALFIFDQLGRGERKVPEEKGLGFLTGLRRRCAQTVLDTRRAADYLYRRTDIDSNRLALAGGSLGAIIAADAAALEPRYRAVWLIYGGGDIPRMLQDNPLLGTSGLVGKLTGWAGGFFLKPIDPRYHVADIAPRPLFMQNGKRDRVIPPECAQQLYDCARQPKQLKWYDSDHIGDDEQVVRQVIADGIAWLKGQV